MPGWLPRLFSPPILSSRRSSGVKTSDVLPAPVDALGITPITVNGSPLSTSVPADDARGRGRSAAPRSPRPGAPPAPAPGLSSSAREGAADDRLLAQGRRRGPTMTWRPLRRSASPPAFAGQDEVRPRCSPTSDSNTRVLVAHVLEVRDGEAHLRHLLGPFGQEHQPVGLVVGQRAQQDRVDHAEDRGVGADAQGQGQDGHGGESGTPRQHPSPVTDVLPPGFHRPSASSGHHRARGCSTSAVRSLLYDAGAAAAGLLEFEAMARLDEPVGPKGGRRTLPLSSRK